jgi:hypothetical protein
MKTFVNLALAVDLHKSAIIARRPDRLTVRACLHGEHPAIVALNVCLAQLQHPIAKAKGGAVANPSGTNSGGRIGQGPLLAL